MLEFSNLKHSHKKSVVGKAGLVFGNLPKLPVEHLDNVGSAYDFPDLRRKFNW